jgi:hypothetical protein
LIPKAEATPRKIADSQATRTTEALLAHHLLQVFVPDGTPAVASSSTRSLGSRSTKIRLPLATPANSVVTRGCLATRCH